MRRLGYGALVICTLATVSGCFRSPTPRFFILAPTTQGSPSSALSAQGPRVALAALTFPAYLLDPRMSVVAEGIEVRRDEFERWAEDLDANFRRVLLDDLSRELASTNVTAADSPFGQAGAQTLRVEVLGFDAAADGVARLRVRWSVATDSLTGAAVISEFSEHVSEETPGARAKALSSLVASLAQVIAGHIKKLP